MQIIAAGETSPRQARQTPPFGWGGLSSPQIPPSFCEVASAPHTVHRGAQVSQPPFICHLSVVGFRYMKNLRYRLAGGAPRPPKAPFHKLSGAGGVGSRSKSIRRLFESVLSNFCPICPPPAESTLPRQLIKRGPWGAAEPKQGKGKGNHVEIYEGRGPGLYINLDLGIRGPGSAKYLPRNVNQHRMISQFMGVRHGFMNRHRLEKLDSRSSWVGSRYRVKHYPGPCNQIMHP